MSATPRPWCLHDDTDIWMQRHGGPCTEWGHGPLIARVHQVGIPEECGEQKCWDKGCGGRHLPETDANAELIVRAVNSHEALVEALRVQVHACCGSTVDPFCDACNQSYAALRLAGALT